MRQYSFAEWLKLNPAAADNDAPCMCCKGKGGDYTDERGSYRECACCHGTGKQAIADAYEVYLTQALRDAKAIYEFETGEHRQENHDKKWHLQFRLDALKRRKREVTL